MTVTELSNEQLLSCLRTVVGDERRLVAKVLAYLGEVEARSLHLAIARRCRLSPADTEILAATRRRRR